MGKRNNIYKGENGYPRFKGSNKLVHRWMAEKKMGRKLRSREVVHHKNRDKGNFRPENLGVFKNQRRHHKSHVKHKKTTGIW